MTAIGFSLWFVGLAIFKFFGSSAIDAYFGKLKTIDYLSITSVVVGFMLFVFGVAKWLWNVMP